MLDYTGGLKHPGMWLVLVVVGEGNGRSEGRGGNGGV